MARLMGAHPFSAGQSRQGCFSADSTGCLTQVSMEILYTQALITGLRRRDRDHPA
jgi:hypothetical protein